MNRDPLSEAAIVRRVTLQIDGSAPLSDALLQALRGACDEVEDGGSSAVLCLYIGGGGGTAPWPGDVAVDKVNRWEQALRRLDRLDGVSVVVASQACGGGALDLLMAADYRVVTTDFKLENLCSAGASWPGMAMHRLANRHGAAAARRIFMFAGELAAAQALQLGLVDEVADDPAHAADALLATLWGRDLSALAARRLLIAESIGRVYEESIGAHLAACDVELRRRHAAAGAAATSLASIEASL